MVNSSILDNSNLKEIASMGHPCIVGLHSPQPMHLVRSGTAVHPDGWKIKRSSGLAFLAKFIVMQQQGQQKQISSI